MSQPIFFGAMGNIAKIFDDNTIRVCDLTQFDIDAIMHSGQVFRYFDTEYGYKLVTGQHYAEIDRRGNIKCSDAQYFFAYFDLDTDYDAIKSDLNRCAAIRPAIEAGGGIRILKAEFVETVISFIISANNNIKRFTKTLNGLAVKCGNILPSGINAFPTLDQLARLSVQDYKELGCGYRAPYLVKTVQLLHDLKVGELCKLSNDDLAKQLTSLSGVGGKVCACIMLFCGDFHRVDIAPVDTWIRKALDQMCPSDQVALLQHRYGGIAQQYIFYYLQHLGRAL